MNISEFRGTLKAARRASQPAGLDMAPPTVGASEGLLPDLVEREVRISCEAAYIFLHLTYWKYFTRSGHIDRFGAWPDAAWNAIMETPSLLHERRRPRPDAPYRIRFVSLMDLSSECSVEAPETFSESDDWFVCGAQQDVRNFALRIPIAARTGRKQISVFEGGDRALHAIFFRIAIV